MSKTAEEIKKEIISKILEEANGSWKDLAEDGYDEGFKQGQAAAPPPASEGEMVIIAEAHASELYDKEGNNMIDVIEGILWQNRKSNFIEGFKAALATLPTREPEGEEKRPCSCIEDEICGICHRSKGYAVVDGKLTPPLPCPPNQSQIK